MTLAEDVLKRHATPDGGGYTRCGECGQDAPCPPYRLAVMVRDIEALAKTSERRSFDPQRPTDPAWQLVRSIDILAITREGK